MAARNHSNRVTFALGALCFTMSMVLIVFAMIDLPHVPKLVNLSPEIRVLYCLVLAQFFAMPAILVLSNLLAGPLRGLDPEPAPENPFLTRDHQQQTTPENTHGSWTAPSPSS